MTRVVDIEGLEVSFATDGGTVVAVDDVSLSVEAGEVLAIVGESGSGKTVTAKSILGLLPENAVTRGAIVLNGTDVLSLTGERLRAIRGTDVAMVFQEPSTSLNPVYTVGWQIAEGLRAHGKLSKREARAKAIEILGKVGIPEPGKRVDHYPHQFSGGQKQRVVIAMALVLEPELIVADEPTTALDVTVQAEILDLLRRCREEFGAAIVLITHNMGIVADLADRVAVMYEGKLVEQAPVAKLFEAPEHPYTQRLLAAVPRIGTGAARAAERLAGRVSAGTVNTDAPVVVAKDLVIEYPGRFGRHGFRGGSLNVLGHEMNGIREREFRPVRGEIGFVFQDPASSFNPLLTIAECVAEPLIVHGVAGDVAAARPRVDELLEAVQLPKEYASRFPHELSGGQRQRASLARSLALEPSLLIADEPTSALDVSVQAKVLELFAELQSEFGFAALFISHDLAVVDMLSDRIAVLYRGELVEEGTGAEVLGAPRHPYTQRLLASLPVPDPAEQAIRRNKLRTLREADQ
ncbi:MAG: ABC transporter ATP-binding protein [Rhodoglobus sp.]